MKLFTTQILTRFFLPQSGDLTTSDCGARVTDGSNVTIENLLLLPIRRLRQHWWGPRVHSPRTWVRFGFEETMKRGEDAKLDRTVSSLSMFPERISIQATEGSI